MSRLHLRLALAFLGVMLVTGTLTALLVAMTPLSPRAQVTAALRGVGDALAADVAERWDAQRRLAAWLDARGRELELNLEVRDEQGAVIAATGPPRGRGGPGRDAPPRLGRGRWAAWRVECPIVRDGATLGTLSLAPRSARAVERYSSRRPSLWPVLLVGLATAFVLLWPISRGLTRRLVALEAVSQRLARGDLAARASAKGRDEVDRLARQFNAMAAALETQQTGRRRFLQAVSHELRSPLTRLRVALELLEQADNPDERRRRLDEAERDIAEVDHLVGQLLTVARSTDELPPLRPESIDAAALARELARPLGVELEGADEPTIVWADSELLSRALRNLLENAARHAPGNQPVAWYVCRREGMIQLCLRDHGPGVPESERERIFEPFYRLDDARDRVVGGVGLGLALVRQAMEQHGGRAHVEAPPDGRGAVFVLSLPNTPPGEAS